jgi:phosphate transport system substrate-binding protein
MLTMGASPFRLAFWIAFSVTILGTAFASQTARSHSVTRIYVEPFVTQAGSETFREDVIAELHKLSSVSLASDESSADAILGGGGEVWVKGHVSHNPRLSRVPPNGTPVYTGFLFVELKDANGQTLWSYLATPPRASGDVAKDLSISIVTNLAAFLDHAESLSRTASLPQPGTILHGAGATFPYPVYAKWFTNYRRENPNVEIDYEPVGSEVGVRKLIANSVDFGASDSPRAIHDLAPGDEKKYLFFPSVVGAVVPVVNLPGLPGDISFTPEALAGIYLGKIKKWNDPVLARANRGVLLPNLDIIVVHRADGSGTSYAWTEYLSRTSTAWNAQIGTSLAPKWPVGREANGNDGVARMVKEEVGAIGYVEFIYALQNHLIYGRVRNRGGEFVLASLESIAAAANHSSKINDDFEISLVDAPGSGVYPISSFTWIVVRAQIADSAKRSAISGFLQWMLGPGQRQAAALGYVALPEELLKKEAAAIGKIN